MKSYVAAHLKDMNRKTVYQLISSVGEISKAEISRRTGISSPTVIKIISFFLDNGFVTETGEGDSAIGRKPQMLRFNPNAAFSIGVEFEGDFLKLGIVDLLGNIKDFKQTRVPPDFYEIINGKLSTNIESIVKQANIPKNKVLGVGLGIPGVVNPDDYIVEFAPLVGISSTKDCRSMINGLSEKMKLPVFVENDVNAAAIGEYVIRKLGPDSDLVYVSLGTGLGAGIILNGKLRRGKHNSAGEIGYMVFDKDYETFRSKAGWMESRINFQALSQKWEFFAVLGPQDNIKSITDPGELKHLSGELKLLVDHVASNLALCIANLSTLIDIDLIVIGGVSAEILGAPLVDTTRGYLSKLCLSEIECQFQMCPEPGVVGAASIVTGIMLDKLLVDQ